MAKIRMIPTEKGLMVPMLDLQGKDYLPVASRIAMFREKHPTGTIATELVQANADSTIAKATILLYNDITKQHQVISTGYSKVTESGFPAHTEKAETAAIGRALIGAGFGTLQCGDDLAEEIHLADAPIERVSDKKQFKAGAGNSNRAAQKAPGPVQAAAVNSPTPAPQHSEAAGKGAAGTSGTPTPANREELNLLISSVSKGLIAKRQATVDALKAQMEGRYGVKDKTLLNDQQAHEFYQDLHSQLNATA